jgi:predicted TIM-barrel fold metal-dependent hydrolase
MDAILRGYHRRGAVGFKVYALPWREPTAQEVNAAFANRGAAVQTPPAAQPLVHLFFARTAALAAELDVPVAAHTGAPWTNWLDFRVWEPTALIPLLTRFPGTHFDLYHGGIPYVTPFTMLGQAFPNVWLNLCWAHIISVELARRALREWLDQVPVNKVLAFGGDYHNRTVVLTCGHLALARRNLASVLAERVQDGRLTEEEAHLVMRAWLSDNPRRLYRL